MKKLLIIFTFFIFATTAMFAKITNKDEDLYYTTISKRLYPNASVAILLNKTEMVVNKDNSVVMKHRVVKKVLNYNGKKKASEYKITYDTRYETVKILKAVTIKRTEDGFKEIPVDKNAIRTIDTPSDEGKMIYAVHKTIVVAFSSVERNDILDITYELKSKEPHKFTDTLILASDEALYNFDYKVVAPKGMVKVVEKRVDKGVVNKTEKGNKDIITIHAEKLPQIVSEPNMPRWSSFLPTIYLSAYKDWAEYRDVLLKKYENKIRITDKIKAIIKKNINETMSTKEKVEKLSKYVAKNLSSIFVGELLTFDVRDVDKTVESGYATSFDRIALFVSLMKGIGVESYPVAVGPDAYYWNEKKEGLDVNNFYYMIAKVNIDGTSYFINPVSEYYQLGEVSYNNNIGLVLRKDKLLFDTISSDKAHPEKSVSIYDMQINKDGTAIVNYKEKEYGNNAAGYRRLYRYMTPKKKELTYQNILGSISQSAIPLTKEMSINLANPVTISFKYRQDNFATVAKKFFYFKLPVSLVPYRLSISPDKKKYPFINLSDKTIVNKVVISYPKNSELLIKPETMKIDSKLFSLERKVKEVNGKMVIVDTIKLKRGVVSTKEYAEFYKKVTSLSNPKYSIVLMKAKRKKFLGLF